MSVDIKVPPVGESVTQATIGALLQPSGSIVSADMELLELETEKVNQVIYAPAAGKVEWKVAVGDQVSVGQVIGVIDTSVKVEQKEEAQGKEKKEQKEEEQEKKEEEQEKKEKEPKTIEAAKSASDIKEIGARKMPPEFLQEKEPSSIPAVEHRTEDRITRKKMSKLRQVIAQRLVEVKNQTAMLTTFNEVDMSAVIAVREKEQENFQKRFGIKLGFMSFFIKACVAALEEYPDINARIDKDEIVRNNFFDIGVAVSTEKGLFVPVLRNVDQMSYADIEKSLKMYAEKARDGSISIDDLQGGTFTITNGGVFGSLLSTPILNPPQSGILGMHNIVKRAVVVDDQIVIRPMMYLALSYDHRIVDGKESIGFLVHLKKSLEEPARLLLDL